MILKRILNFWMERLKPRPTYGKHWRGNTQRQSKDDKFAFKLGIRDRDFLKFERSNYAAIRTIHRE